MDRPAQAGIVRQLLKKIFYLGLATIFVVLFALFQWEFFNGP